MLPANDPNPPDLEEARRLVLAALDRHSPEGLVGLVSRLLREARDARRTALHDELTGLANRRALHAGLRHGIATSRRYEEPLALVLVDLDGFKAVNDRHGHAAGDAALRAVGAVLRQETRADVDLAARLGGDEFALVLPRTDEAGAAAVGERVVARIRALPVRSPSVALGASFGAAALAAGEAEEELLARADAALYRAKRSRARAPYSDAAE